MRQCRRDQFRASALLATAALASLALAPFIPFIDGSVWARNPMALAVIEAMGILLWPRETIRVLSLGCTAAHFDVLWKKHTSLGTAFWAARLADVFMKAQSSSALVTANVLIGPENVFRIDPDTSEHRFTLDGVQHLPLLRELGENEASRAFSTLGPVFLQEKAAPFVPFHGSPPAGLATPLLSGAGADGRH